VVVYSTDVHPTAIVSETARIWSLSQIREEAVIGDGVVIGRGVYVGIGVHIGAFSKIQNGAQIFEPARISRGVFIGPGTVLTNDRVPRATDPGFRQKNAQDWTPVGVIVEEGASIGAACVCVAPLRLGRWAMVAAGSTVIRDVPDHALVAGNPATFIGWISEEGERLVQADSSGVDWKSGTTGRVYRLEARGLVPLE
jgi:UDP-2-acetamido-3-amino-2,3-dideoxy-glucuronate N-acetyltransferase